MTAWVRVELSFREPRSLELLAGGSSYQYESSRALVLDRAILPCYSRHRDDAFYYISRTHSVPGYLQLRYGKAASGLSAVSFGFMTILMSGVNMFAMAKVMQVVLVEHSFQHLGFVADVVLMSRLRAVLRNLQ